jgi:ribosomal protection tetracycline resistance protein
LSVLDGAVLVISAVEGVQSQTRVLMRTLQRLRIPTLIFVNKIDRTGARYDGVLLEISDSLAPSILAMGSVDELGTRSAEFVPFAAGERTFSAAMADLLAHHDDAILAAYVTDEAAVSPDGLRRALAQQTEESLVHPVFFGSAITGAGVDVLMTGITHLLPAADGDADDLVSGAVFKIERGAASERIAYARMFSGTVRTRDRMQFGAGREQKVTAIRVFDQGSAVQRGSVVAGEIAQLWGLGDIQIGDVLGEPRAGSNRHFFAPPTLETVVVPCRRSEKGALHAALVQLAEQDPLIDLRQDDVRQEIFVSLYGEVQKEVIRDTLAIDFGIDVEFRETTTICIERPTRSGSAVEIIDKESANPFLATVGLRIDPASVDSGVQFQLEVELGSMPLAFLKAVEETVHETLRQGIHGWQVTDCMVTMTKSGYWARQSSAHGVFDASMSSTAGDFRNLTPLVLMDALRKAGTVVHEPMHRFHLEVPSDVLGQLMRVLSRLRAVPRTQEMPGATCTIEGEIPAEHVHDLQQQLPSLTRGEGVLESAFECYQPVRGAIPSRSRSDNNPLNRKEYLLHMLRRV